MITTILLIFFIIVYLGIAIYINILLLIKQKKINKQYNNVSDMIKCPETVQYFNNFQSSFQTWSLGVISMGYVGFIMIIFLLLLKNMIKNNISIHPSCIGYNSLNIPMILLISFVCSLLVFIAVYKTQNCLLSRICSMGDCSKNFFKSLID